MNYKVDDKNIDVSMFNSFVNQVWQGNYDVEQTRWVLSKTLNITTHDNKKLAGGCVFTPTMLYFGSQPEAEKLSDPFL